MQGTFAAGRILNEKTARSQCFGGMVFGIGAALMEQIHHDKRDGRLCNHDLAEYQVCVNADVPDLEDLIDWVVVTPAAQHGVKDAVLARSCTRFVHRFLLL